MDGSGYETLALHLAQGLGEHLVADAGNHLTEPGEANLTMVGEHLDDHHRPFISNAAD